MSKVLHLNSKVTRSQFQISLFKMDKLPLSVLEEVLRKVFELLPREDRKAGVMVNSKWREVGEARHLWAWVALK